MTRIRGVLALVLLFAVAVGFASAAAAQPPAITVESIDTTSEPGIIALVSDATPADLAVEVNGTAATIVDVNSVRDTEQRIDTFIVLDNAEAGRTDDQARVDLRAEAAMALVEAAAVNETIGVVTTGGGAKIRVGLGASTEATDAALSRVNTGGPSALWDAIRLAGIELNESSAAIKRLIVIGDQPDALSTVSIPAARAELLNADAATYVLTVAGESFPTTDLTTIANMTNGAVVTAESFEALPGAALEVEDRIDDRYLIEFSSASLYTGNDLVLHINGLSATFNMVPGSSTSGRTLTPLPPTAEQGKSFLAGDNGLRIGLVLGAAAAGLLAYGLATVVFRTDELSSMLSAYGTEQAIEGNSARALYERALNKAGEVAEKRGLVGRIQGSLDAADLAVRPGEAIVIQIAVTLGTGVVVLLLTRNPLYTMIGFLLGAFLPTAFVNNKVRSRKKEFEAQLPPMLQLLSSTLKAGYSFMQGVEAVSHEIEGPMGQELRRVVTEAQLGRPVEQALAAAADRMDSEDFHWVVMAVEIQREVGGNLSEVLMTVADTMMARERLRGEVAALTAEGKISAVILGGLPPGLGVVMYLINPGYISTLFSRTIGYILIAVATVAALIGFAWMKKIITIEI